MSSKMSRDIQTYKKIWKNSDLEQGILENNFNSEFQQGFF